MFLFYVCQKHKISLAQQDITYPSYGGMDYVTSENILVTRKKMNHGNGEFFFPIIELLEPHYET